VCGTRARGGRESRGNDCLDSRSCAQGVHPVANISKALGLARVRRNLSGVVALLARLVRLRPAQLEASGLASSCWLPWAANPNGVAEHSLGWNPAGGQGLCTNIFVAVTSNSNSSSGRVCGTRQSKKSLIAAPNRCVSAEDSRGSSRSQGAAALAEDGGYRAAGLVTACGRSSATLRPVFQRRQQDFAGTRPR